MESRSDKNEKSPTMIMRALFYTGIMTQPEKKASNVVSNNEPTREEIVAAVESQYEQEAKAENASRRTWGSLFSWLSSWSGPADDQSWPVAEMAPEIVQQQPK